MKTDTEVIKTVKTKIQQKVVPIVSIVVGLGLLFTGGFLFFKKTQQPKSNPANHRLVFQSLQKGQHKPGEVLVKLKADVGPQDIINSVLSRPYPLIQNESQKNGNVDVSLKFLELPPQPKNKRIKISLLELVPVFAKASQPSVKEKILRKNEKQNAKLINKLQKQREGLNRWYKILVTNEVDIPALVSAFSSNPGVEAAQPNYQYSTAPLLLPTDEGSRRKVPNDPFYQSSGTWGKSYPDLWGLKRINMDGAWKTTFGYSNVVVAVIDTGIDKTHPDLNQLWNNVTEIPDNKIDDYGNGYVDDVWGWDFAFNSNNTSDLLGHGTHVSGTIGAIGNNAIGIPGINWKLQLMSLRGLDGLGQGYDYNLASAIKYAADNGAEIINMSWGGADNSFVIAESLEYAHTLGATLVAAAGNTYQDVKDFYPANLPNVISVAAMDQNNTLASFSNFGQGIDVMAPGVDILSLRADETDMYCLFDSYYCDPAHSQIVKDSAGYPLYYRADGTSMAAPHVAGVAALIRSLSSNFSPELIEYVIKNTVEFINETCNAMNTCGFHNQILCSDPRCRLNTVFKDFGILNAAAALNLSQQMVRQPKPELFVRAGFAHMPTVTLGELTAIIVNGGIDAASNVHYKIFVGDPSQQKVLTDQVIPKLLPSQIVDLRIPLTTKDIAPLYFTIQVDPSNQIPEYIESNNQSTVPVSPEQLAGWPQAISDQLSISSPAIADIDRNGTLDFVLGDYWNNLVHAYQADGVPVPGWPQEVGNEVYSSPAIADLDADGQPEVIAATGREGSVYVWKKSKEKPNQWEEAAGWPQPTGQPLLGPEPGRIRINGSPATDDIDSDGLPEIVIGAADGNVYAWNGDGTSVPGWPQQTGSDIYATPTISDLDADGIKEIIAGTRLNKVFAWHANGTVVDGWPMPTGGLVFTSVTVGDLNNDGKLEVAVGDISAIPTLPKFYVWQQSSTDPRVWENVPGWPKILTESDQFDRSPVMADVDHDGVLEIIAPMGSGSNGAINIWHFDGTTLAGWPKTELGRIAASPAIADLDGDSYLEVVVGSNDNNMNVWRYNGNLLPGWPQKVEGFGANFSGIPNSAAITDLDEDGRLEIIAGTKIGVVNVWTMPIVSKSQRFPWSTYLHDNQRTGRYPGLTQSSTGGGLKKIPTE